MIDYNNYLSEHTIDELKDAICAEESVSLIIDCPHFLAFKNLNDMKYYCADKYDCEVLEVQLVGLLSYDIKYDAPHKDKYFLEVDSILSDMFDCDFHWWRETDNTVECLYFNKADWCW